MLTCLRSLLVFLKCTSFFASSSLQRLSRLLLLSSLRLLRWWLSSRSLIDISISACFDKCWRMLDHHDQKIWCCRCVHRLNVVMTHMCRVFIEHARKCKHCFKEKHDCMMNLVLRSLQLTMHYAARTMIQHFIAHAWDCLVLRLRQWKSE